MIGIVGATATGKTALAVALAKTLGAELLNADSRQAVRGLSAATCAPTAAELSGVACHLLALCEPGDRFTVADWLGRARVVVAELEQRAVPLILVGGTGLYVDALVDGFEVAGDRAALPQDPAAGDGAADDRAAAGRRSVRAEVATSDNRRTRADREHRAALPEGLVALAAELRERDPEAAREVDLRNPRRVIRALEILDTGSGGLRSLRRRAGGHAARLIGIEVDRTTHLALVRARAEAMFAEGALLTETSDALERGVAPEALVRSGIGYGEAMAVMRRELTVDQAVNVVVARTLRYAKAQRTWFRHRHDVTWLRRRPGPDWVIPLLAAALETLDAAAP